MKKTREWKKGIEKEWLVSWGKTKNWKTHLGFFSVLWKIHRDGVVEESPKCSKKMTRCVKLVQYDYSPLSLSRMPQNQRSSELLKYSLSLSLSLETRNVVLCNPVSAHRIVLCLYITHFCSITLQNGASFFVNTIRTELVIM